MGSQDGADGPHPPKASGDELASLARTAQSLLSTNENDNAANGNDANDDEDIGGGPTVRIRKLRSIIASA